VISVILLVKNGLPFLPEVLDGIFRQSIDAPYEVVAIDSGSTDGSIDTLSDYPVRLIRIPPTEFNHGETRNFAVRKSHSNSQYIIFLSQDACPANERWLHTLIQPLVNDELVAGVFSRHLPRPGTSPSLIRQLTTVWQSGGNERIVKEMPRSEVEYTANKFYYVYFSNTSSAIRRTVWEQIPFRFLAFAEDADWADRVLHAGFRLVFEPSSTVLHSHDYSIIEQFRQNVDHTEAMVKLFDPPAYKDRWLLLRQLKNLPKEVWRDSVFMRRSPYHAGSSLGERIGWILRSPFWHLASFTGGWVGANIHRLPVSWRIFFRRQERLMRESEDW
jgi:rhamnosyltransferase